LSHLRPREDLRSKQDYGAAEIRHRQPDAGILDHERKRKVEVKCLELQIQLEDEEVAEDEISARVGELRKKLLAQSAPITSGDIRP
jgi:serine/arginine repetitive matrix protein 2